MARTDEQFNHRIPAPLKKEFDEEAKANGRSSTQHLIHILKHRNDPPSGIERMFEFARNQEIFNNAVMDVLKPLVPKARDLVKPTIAKEPVRLMNTRILNDDLSLHLSKRVSKQLGYLGVSTVRDLSTITTAEAKAWVGIGKKAMDEINGFVLKNGFKYINK